MGISGDWLLRAAISLRRLPPNSARNDNQCACASGRCERCVAAVCGDRKRALEVVGEKRRYL